MFKRRCKKQAPVNNNSFAEKSQQIDKLAGRFSLDLETLAEEEANIMELIVQVMLILNVMYETSYSIFSKRS